MIKSLSRLEVGWFKSRISIPSSDKIKHITMNRALRCALSLPFLLLSLLLLASTASDNHRTCSPSDAECHANSRDQRPSTEIKKTKVKKKRRRLKPLRPRNLSPDTIFSNWTTTDDFVYLPAGGVQRVSRGAIQQNGNSDSFSHFDVLHNIVKPEEAMSILGTLRGDGIRHSIESGGTLVPLDADPDTVDGMPTHEMFIDNLELRQGNPSKSSLDGSKARELAVMESRESIRRRLREIVDPILEERLTPYVRQRYPEICGGADSSKHEDDERACTPCFSLLRKYHHDERTSHSIHHDGHALVTIVVSLSVREADYNGGLYVATKSSQRQYVGLTRGDAVVHRGDLYHGVKVLPATEEEQQQGTRGDAALAQRWSWILWYRDSTKCEDHGHEWFQECAEQGNPTCELLHATKVANAPGKSKTQEDMAKEILYWNQRASDHGHGGASIKLARAYLKLLPSALSFSEEKAIALYHQAIATSNHPDAHYGLATLLVHPKARGNDIRKAVLHLER